ncbi:9891_t:CDS:2 [Cetraspora pellucida]|uniref:9891_t:CDS:1 n=1 Tax=Cetraspora pellucida TaxID=1433469 RepID=A0A9N9CID2_9GLOM|nr:9891_t:CDS:2 [Cetraspora pellucida]
MSITELSNYAEELVKHLKDAKAHDHAQNQIQKLGFSKDQTYALIPIQTSGRCVTGRDLVKKLDLYIKKNETNLKPEWISELAHNLAKTRLTVIAQSSLLKLLQKKLHQLNANYITLEAIYDPNITQRSNKEQVINQELREDKRYDCSEFFYLENVQKRLKDCNITNSPTMQNLMDIMIMLSMRSADVANLRIDYYKPSNANWYDSKYSWYCTRYAKNKKDEPRSLVSMKKDLLLARELLIWIQKAIPNEFTFLIKDKDGDVNVHPINNFLAIYGISSLYLRKIGSDYAIIIHEGHPNSLASNITIWKLNNCHKCNKEILLNPPKAFITFMCDHILHHDCLEKSNKNKQKTCPICFIDNERTTLAEVQDIDILEAVEDEDEKTSNLMGVVSKLSINSGKAISRSKTKSMEPDKVQGLIKKLSMPNEPIDDNNRGNKSKESKPITLLQLYYNANQAEKFKEIKNDNSRYNDQQARGLVYDKVTTNLLGFTKDSLGKKTAKARNIYKLFGESYDPNAKKIVKEIEIEKIKKIRIYSTDYISKLNFTQIYNIIKHFN